MIHCPSCYIKRIEILMAKIVKTVKMSDIAERLNISVVTVSKALSDQKGVSEEMREKIKALAQDMGYKYVAPIKDKERGKSYNIGVLVSKYYMDSSENFYVKMCQEVAAKATQRGCFAFLEFIQEDDEREGRLPKLITEDKIDGVIVVGKPQHDYARILEETLDKPMLFLDFYDTELHADAVVTDNYLGAYKLAKYLIHEGHKNIGFVGTLMVTDSITDRDMGYVKAMMEHNIAVDTKWLIKDRAYKSGQMQLYAELELPERLPTAFVCNCDYTASTLIKTLEKCGKHVPEDVSVVGFDNYLHPGLCDIGITTYEVNIGEMAKKAVEIIYNRLAGAESESRVSTVEGRLVERDSVKNIKKIV